MGIWNPTIGLMNIPTIGKQWEFRPQHIWVIIRGWNPKEIIVIVTAHRQEDEHQGMLSVISDSFGWRGHKENNALASWSCFFLNDFFYIFWKNATRFAAVSLNFHPGMCFCRGTLFLAHLSQHPIRVSQAAPKSFFETSTALRGWITVLGINILPILLYRLALLSRWFSEREVKFTAPRHGMWNPLWEKLHICP